MRTPPDTLCIPAALFFRTLPSLHSPAYGKIAQAPCINSIACGRDMCHRSAQVSITPQFFPAAGSRVKHKHVAHSREAP